MWQEGVVEEKSYRTCLLQPNYSPMAFRSFEETVYFNNAHHASYRPLLTSFTSIHSFLALNLNPSIVLLQ